MKARLLFAAALACAVTVGVALAPPAAAATDDDLSGLWSAKRWFGAHARGPLILQKSRQEFLADMAGYRVPVRAKGNELSFDLPNGQGGFRGRIEAGDIIRGHWFPPRSVAQNAGSVVASPVQLEPDGANRWSGEVVPYDDVFTFWLQLTPRAGGGWNALLRNPERDWGVQIGVERLVREGDALRLMGRRRGQAEERELARGTWDAESKTITLGFPSRGGSYDFSRDDDESGFYPRGRNPGRYAYQPPPALEDGWPAGTLEDARIDRAAIEKLVQKIVDMPMDSAGATQVHGILIARGGRLVLEEYFHGESRDRPHDTRSAAKSLTAIIVGAAIQAGAPIRLTSPVYQVMNGGVFPADLEPRKRAMTLEHLLTMSSGYYCDDTDPAAPGNEETMLEQTGEPDFYRYTLAVPMATAPGEKAVYCSANPNLALGMVARATGESPLVLFDRLVGGPLQIRRYGWGPDPAGNPYGGGGVRMMPRDFMKLGQLMLNGGTWQGRRILARDFVASATSRLYHLRNIYYGYQWWGIDFPYKDRTVAAYYAGGAGGQAVTVIPELDLVIANYGGSYAAGRGGLRFFMEFVPRYVLPAVREPGDDPSAPVREREFTTPYGRSTDGGRVARPASGPR